MGQQQLLLLILSAIIVGLAIVTGINMFGENAVQANKDAVMQDLLTLATRAQGWYRRPAQLGGGNRSFANATLDTLDFPGTNGNGIYTIQGTPGTSITFRGAGNEGLTLEIDVFPDSVGALTVQ